MEFGLFFLMQRDEAWSERSVYESGLAQMLAAESLGYSSVWIAEHHFNDYGLCPAPQVLASYVAARTTTLRLGMGVSLLPLHHPVDLAEELAVLDVVSGGPLDVGIGRGGTMWRPTTTRRCGPPRRHSWAISVGCRRCDRTRPAARSRARSIARC
jgi:alkanesulfonate monooxygenase SsuD/methylene tetrahydromethanopterin reductase-like flavin-dependent oxidoreductase (luciferase family)